MGLLEDKYSELIALAKYYHNNNYHLIAVNDNSVSDTDGYIHSYIYNENEVLYLDGDIPIGHSFEELMNYVWTTMFANRTTTEFIVGDNNVINYLSNFLGVTLDTKNKFINYLDKLIETGPDKKFIQKIKENI